MWVPGQEASKTVVNRPAITAPAVRIPEETTPAANISVQPKDNFLAALAYVTFVPAAVFLLIGPLKHNRFIRFHSLQSIYLTVATIAVAIVIRIAYSILTLIPVIGFLLAWLVLAVTSLGCVILWLVLLVKALQGATFKLPLIGNLAEKV